MDKKISRAWCLSIFVISIVSIVFAICNIKEIELPDMVRRSIGILDLIALPVLGYTSVKKMKNKN